MTCLIAHALCKVKARTQYVIKPIHTSHYFLSQFLFIAIKKRKLNKNYSNLCIVANVT